MDITAASWNEDDNANTASAPDGAPEGMAPSGVNNVLRAHQGALKRFYGWTIPRLTSGSATAYVLNYAVAPSGRVDGMTHLMQFHAANGIDATINVNNLGATPLHYYAAEAWRIAPPGLVGVNQVFRVAFHGDSGAYRLLDYPNRTGEVLPFAGRTAPSGSLLCYGQIVSRTTYAGLFAAIDTAYGAGDGSTTFQLPDLRGRVPAGKSDMGGSESGNLAGAGLLNAALGSQTNTASTTVSGSGAAIGTAITDGAGQAEFRSSAGPQEQQVTLNHTHAVHINIPVVVTASGTSGAFSIVQPTRVLNYLIRI
ncbi:MAG: phage tail protein [Reyranella sp.]|nr:phage tail protein [Reyranella sp.]